MRAHSYGGWRVWRTVLILLAVVLFAAVMALGAGFTYAKHVAELDTIYPNVNVNGVDVGGMTVAQAAAALGDAPERYENAAVTVNFPTGESVTVTAQDLGLQPMDGTGFARAAYAYGRGGTMLSNLRTYLACRNKPVFMAVDGVQDNSIDESIIAEKLRAAADAADAKLDTVKAQIGQDAITVVKNDGAAHVDVLALAGQVRQAFQTENYAPIDCEAQAVDNGESSPIDIDAVLQRLYNEVYAAPADAYYDQATGQTVEGTAGVRFDMEAAKAAWDAAANGETVTIPLIREEPAVTADQLPQQFFTDVLAEKSTTLAGSTYARINNITLAAAAMNGVVLQPGEQFDYNACLGQRTEAKGYQSAGAFSGGQHVMSIGGGICQGSSTLYYCALKANLTITDRWCHQFLVAYLPRGMDATVSWGWPDFKFVNSRSYPIKIAAWVSGGYLTIQILGTDVDGSYVDITNETWEDATHYYAQTYRNVYDKNGNLISSQKEAYSCYDKEEAVAATAAPAPVQQQVTQAPQVPAAEAPPAVADVPVAVPESQPQQSQPEPPPPEPEAVIE